MAFQKKTWLARLGQGLNKFIFNGGSKVTLDSSPDVVTQEGTPLSAENMNDLEDRIEAEFTNVNEAITSLNADVDGIKTAMENATLLYSMSGQLTPRNVTLSENAYHFKKLMCFHQAGSTGLHYCTIIYPFLDSGYALRGFSGQTGFESYGSIINDGATLEIYGSTVSNHVYNLKVYGVKAY